MFTVSFYSFKGGSGRSTTCLNAVPYLCDQLGADKDNPLLLLDMDLDSAGMTYLLGLEDYFHQNYDIKQFLKAESNDLSQPVDNGLENHPFIKKTVPVGNKFGLADDRSVIFLGVNDESIFDPNDIGGEKGELFKSLKQFCRKNGIKAIVMDTSTGDQVSATIATSASDKIVCCMKNTMQFRIGTFNYLQRLAKNDTDKQIIIFPTVVPQTDFEIDGEMQREKSINSILRKSENLPFATVNTDFVMSDMFGINEIERFKWKEDILYKIEKDGNARDDEKEGIKRYNKLASIIIGD